MSHECVGSHGDAGINSFLMRLQYKVYPLNKTGKTWQVDELHREELRSSIDLLLFGVHIAHSLIYGHHFYESELPSLYVITQPEVNTKNRRVTS